MDFFGLGNTIDEAKKAATDIVETAMATVRGNIDEALPQWLGTITNALDGWTVTVEMPPIQLPLNGTPPIRLGPVTVILRKPKP